VTVGLLYALTALAAALMVYGSPSSPLTNWAYWLSAWLWIPASILPATFVPLVFPDGHLPSLRWRFTAWSAALGLLVVVLVVMFHPGPLSVMGLAANPFGIPVALPILDKLLTAGLALLLIGVMGSLAGFSVRFRRSTGVEREQMKWLLYALGIMLLGFVLSAGAWYFWPDNPWMGEISIAISDLSILSIALAALIAILRHQLYDINLIINRTLVYSALTIGILTFYILVVGGLGALFQAGNNLFLSLLATGLVAILFQPMRERLQRAANHLMYGERDDPYAVLSRLGRRLEASLSPQAALPAVVETLARSLKLPYVAIALKQDGDFQIAAQYGLAQDAGMELPLVYQGAEIGRFILAAHSPNEPFRPAELRLIEDIAHQIGVAAHAVHLTHQLRQLADDLQHSRQRLVTAREEERRRLRRDLHDGLGPVLAGQGLKLGVLQQLVQHDPRAAGSLIEELIAQNQGVMGEIRRLVYDLRPPALDELGLVEAVRDQVIMLSQAPDLGPQLQVRVEGPPGGLPPLPAAIEVAAYRIALEAITNVVRHAHAGLCVAKFSIQDVSPASLLDLEICDDGLGLPENYRSGVGLTSMHARAEEVGGTCQVKSLPAGGTRVLARLPIFQ
jgi:signal transduction histidine kinase